MIQDHVLQQTIMWLVRMRESQAGGVVDWREGGGVARFMFSAIDKYHWYKTMYCS